jgi:signal transduction histidine kinase/ligand-binding sensor domain-containing protein/DNA-binding response OmpR family regulator
MWIGTRSGLNRYDGYNFKIFKHNFGDSTSIPNNVVQSIVKDQLGRFWIQVPSYLCIFNPSNEEFTNNFTIVADKRTFQNFILDMAAPCGDSLLFLRVQNEGIIRHNIFSNKNQFLSRGVESAIQLPELNITRISVYGRYLYVTYENGLIDQIEAQTLKLEKRITGVYDKLKLTGKQFETFIDNDENIWVFCNDEAVGVFMIDANGTLRHFNTESNPSLNSNIISCMVQAPDSKLWIGTDHGGINILNPTDNTISYITHDPFNENSLSQNVITELYMGNDSIIWIGTFKQGVNYYHENIYRFWHYVNFPNNDKTLPYNDVNCFAEDKSGNLWIGTNGNGLIYFDRKNNSFKTIKAQPGNPNALQSDVIVSLLIDKKNQLWIGTYHGGLSLYDGQKFNNFMHDPTDSRTISDNKIWDLFEDSKGQLWVGLLGGGLDRFDADKKVFHHYSKGGINAMSSNFVMSITEDNDGNIWFGTDQGVFVLDHESARFIQFQNEYGNNKSLTDNFVYNVFKDSKGGIWAGTRNGINFFDKQENIFLPIKNESHATDFSIMSILESDDGHLWLGTSSGLAKMVVRYDESGHYKDHYSLIFNETDGLQGREFNEGSALKTSRGEMIFGGPNGFNLFIPENSTTYTGHITPQITGLEIFGNSVPINNKVDGRKIIHSTTLNGSTLELNSSQNMFSLSFALIDYLTPKKVHYRYKLDGFNDQWIYTTWQDRKATFTNLNPGSYRFIVQSSDFLSEWNASEAWVNIDILPPWHRSWYAYVAYFFVIISILFIMQNYISMRIRNKYLKDQAEEEALRQYELNSLKSRFFTNVSHEFRTPLTLIITPLDNLLKSDLEPNTRNHLQLIRQNAGRLLNLVNQLLDFRKAGENKLQIDLTYGNIINHLRKTVEAFSVLSESKKIDLQFVSYEAELFMQFDKDKIEKIINNLLSNAFKFNHDGGSIHVISQLSKVQNKEFLTIKVKDMGIGIEKEHRDKLFERFYQVNQSRDFITTGSGIGLALTKEFVELHHGSISVESEPGQGSCFTVSLPVNRQRLSKHLEESNNEDPNEEKAVISLLEKDKRTILLVEDNLEFRGYLKESLQNKYNILEADNGKLGLELLQSHDPDLIVSDIMMPVMDGIELCKQVKTNQEYSHIPIILLTAKSTHEDKVTGFKVGADEYITKPFDLDILESRINYLIHLRQKFIKEYQKSLRIESNAETITTLDGKLLNKVLELINQNLSNPDFSVNQLSKELSVSRVHLYKKTMSLTGKTPIELIRLVRMKKAADLVLAGQLTISEISYDVGFGDPRYFSKQFKNEFGVLPSRYKDQQNKEEETTKG